MVKKTIQDALSVVVRDLGLAIDPKIEHPTDPSHGDYSSNIAMTIFANSEFRIQNSEFKTPMDLAQDIKKKLEVSSKLLEVIERIEIAKPGFINFWLAKDYLISQLEEVIKGTPLRPAKRGFAGFTPRIHFRASHQREHPAGQGKIMLEFADPNPFKEFHIGHLRNITLGESFCRLLESQGATVWRVNYQGDVGVHVAKALYGLQQLVNGKLQLANLERKPLKEKVKVLGKAYTLGAKAYEENEGAKEEIKALNIKVYRNDPEVVELWEMGRRWSLEHFETIYKRVGTAYKRYYPESEVAAPGRKIVLDHITDGIFERHDGAVIFRGEKHGLHTRVFVTKEDYATYEAKDMALAGIKYKDFPYDRSIIITAHEQAPYFTVVLSAMRQVFPELAQKTTHISFGFVRLKDTKMSSRLGNIITGEWLLEEAKTRIKKKFSAPKGRDLARLASKRASGGPDMDEETSEMVAVGAVKYSMLKFSVASDIAFSFEESISLEGNSGPYIQYSFARTQSVLAKSKVKSQKSKVSLKRRDLLRLEPEEVNLLRLIHRFPEVVAEASQNFAPNILCNYLFDLAQSFNLFYQKHKILGVETLKEHEETSNFRLALTAAVGQVLKNGLYLLGIEAPKRM